jgi:hypothetical protein
MELSGVKFAGAVAPLVTEAPAHRSAPTAIVTPGNGAHGASGERAASEQNARAAEARDIAKLRREMEQRGLAAGPPPTFRLNLLEAESGVSQAIARAEAAWSHARDAAAVRPAAPDLSPAPDTAPADEQQS